MEPESVERAVATHRRTNPAADHAAEPVAIYDLQRPQAYGLPAAHSIGSASVTTAAGPDDARGS